MIHEQSTLKIVWDIKRERETNNTYLKHRRGYRKDLGRSPQNWHLFCSLSMKAIST